MRGRTTVCARGEDGWIKCGGYCYYEKANEDTSNDLFSTILGTTHVGLNYEKMKAYHSSLPFLVQVDCLYLTTHHGLISLQHGADPLCALIRHGFWKCVAHAVK